MDQPANPVQEPRISLKLLLAEDSENDALLLLRELRKGGYECDCLRVDSAKAMREAFAARDWDLVISDYVMPDFGGLEAVSIARELDPDIPLIIVSGNIGEDIAVRAMKAGADDYIMKTNLKRLVAAIERELREADNRRRRRIAEKALRTSEASLAEAQSIAHIGNWESDVNKGTLQISDELYRIFGLPAGQVNTSFDCFLRHVHHDDRRAVEISFINALRLGHSFAIDHRIIVDGKIRLVHNKTQVSLDENGAPARILGTIQDITERREAEDTLRALSHRLITLQEEQSRTIARELHDQFGQTLTVLKILLERVKRVPPENAGPVIDQSRVLADELFKKVHDMSLNLRPPMLDDLGLLPALIWHIDSCREQTQMKIQFKHTGLEQNLPPEVTTVAYRIVQEGLTNVLRHSGTNAADVRLLVEDDTLKIRIKDEGNGFNAAGLKGNRIGLKGMQERAAWLGGIVRIESAPGKGTEVMADLPLHSRKNGGA